MVMKNLKIGFNRVFGYYLEVTRSYYDLVPENRWIRKQTLANSERFITEELKKHENDVLSAQFKSLELEQKIFNDLAEYSKAYVDIMKENTFQGVDLNIFKCKECKKRFEKISKQKIIAFQCG